MIACPSCQQTVEILDKNLGTLFTCPHCNSVYFIDWNGQPELAQHEPVSAEADLIESPGQDLQQTQDFQQSQEFIHNQDQEISGAVEQGSESPTYDFGQTLDTQPNLDVDSSQSVQADSSDFSDVTSFANTDREISPLIYSLTISGLDSSRLLANVKEAMKDSRFAWNVEEILRDVKGGQLTITGLTPVKAAVLVNRIKFLPLKITWRQDVLSSN